MSTCIAAREGKERDREIDEDRALSYCDIVLLMSTRANNILVLRVFAIHLYKYKCVCVHGKKVVVKATENCRPTKCNFCRDPTRAWLSTHL